MNKQCLKCGFINDNDCSFCTNCGVELQQVVIQQPIQQNINHNVVVSQQIDNSKGNKFGIISLLLFFGGLIIPSYLYHIKTNWVTFYLLDIGKLFPLAGIVVMIVGRSKYPTNTLLKVTMWIFISMFALLLLGIILLVVLLVMLGMSYG